MYIAVPLLLERCNVQDDVDDVRHFFPLSLAALLLWVKGNRYSTDEINGISLRIINLFCCFGVVFTVFKYIISYFSFLVYLTSILLFYVKCVLLGVSKSTHARYYLTLVPCNNRFFFLSEVKLSNF